jgi:hypothetical protein
LVKAVSAAAPALFKTPFANEIADLLRAHFPIIQVFTYEEERALKVVVDVAKALTSDIQPTKFNLDRLVELSGDTQFGPDIRMSGAEIEAWVSEV